MRRTGSEPGWALLSSHGFVLLCIAERPGVRVRDIAATVRITERACYRILADLTAAGLISRERRGRRNHYEVHPEARLRHPAFRNCPVGPLLSMVDSARDVPHGAAIMSAVPA